MISSGGGGHSSSGSSSGRTVYGTMNGQFNDTFPCGTLRSTVVCDGASRMNFVIHTQQCRSTGAIR